MGGGGRCKRTRGISHRGNGPLVGRKDDNDRASQKKQLLMAIDGSKASTYEDKGALRKSKRRY